MTPEPTANPEPSPSPRGGLLDAARRMLRRRAGEIAYAAAILALLALILAMSIPPVYRSSATLVAQAEEIPAGLANSSLADVARERLAVINQQVLTRAALLEVVDKLDLYRTERRLESMDEILARMRRSIAVTTVGASVADRPGSVLVNATIPFEISFESNQAPVAQRVAAELVSLYLNENGKGAAADAAESPAGLAAQLASAAAAGGFDVPPAANGEGGARPEVPLARALEQALREADRFTVIDPPVLPERPARPDRPMIVLIGLIVAALGGLAFGALRERLDRTIRDATDLDRFISAPVLGRVPLVKTPIALATRSNTGRSLASIGAATVILLLAFVHYFVIELQILWYIATQRLGL